MRAINRLLPRLSGFAFFPIRRSLRQFPGIEVERAPWRAETEKGCAQKKEILPLDIRLKKIMVHPKPMAIRSFEGDYDRRPDGIW